MIDKTAYILEKFPGQYPNSKGVIHTHCPFHDDAKPSFSIDVEEGLFFCGSVSCGMRGNFPIFYKLMEGIDNWKQVFSDLRNITSHYDVDELFTKAPYKVKEYVVNSFPQEPCIEPIQSLQYLEDRGLGKDVIDAYGLVYGSTGVFDGVNIRGSIVVPVWDLDYSYKTFQVRYLNPKSSKRWLNPQGSQIQSLLYGGWLVSPDDNDLWIVEGASDVWRLFSYGVKAVGLNTKEASSVQLNRLIKLSHYFKLRPIVMLDGDASVPRGTQEIDYAQKLYNELSASATDPAIVRLEYSEDPGGLSYERFCEVSENV